MAEPEGHQAGWSPGQDKSVDVACLQPSRLYGAMKQKTRTPLLRENSSNAAHACSDPETKHGCMVIRAVLCRMLSSKTCKSLPLFCICLGTSAGPEPNYRAYQMSRSTKASEPKAHARVQRRIAVQHPAVTSNRPRSTGLRARHDMRAHRMPFQVLCATPGTVHAVAAPSPGRGTAV